METLERSRVCRLCGKSAAITIDIFSKRENYVKKMNLILPISVHEMDFLPKCLCYPCNYKLQDFHQFYQACLKTDANFKDQLSWMQGSKIRKDITCPMVEINNIKIKEEPLDCEGEESAEPLCNNENLMNCSDNNNTQFCDRGTKFSTSTCCNSKKSTVDATIKRCGTSKSKNYQSMKQKVIDYVSRDTIRRNLFSTEVFGKKNHRVQTEIPICNFSGQAASDAIIKEINLAAGTKRLDCRQRGNVTITNIEKLDDTTKIIPRMLRSGDKDRGAVDSTSVKAVPLVKVKQEPLYNMERSLRPRRAFINYSETSIKIIVPRSDDLRRRAKRVKVPKYDGDRRKGIRNTLKTDTFSARSAPSVKQITTDYGTMLIRRPLIPLVKLKREDFEMYLKDRSWNFQQPNKRLEITDELDRKKSKINCRNSSFHLRVNNGCMKNVKNVS